MGSCCPELLLRCSGKEVAPSLESEGVWLKGREGEKEGAVPLPFSV